MSSKIFKNNQVTYGMPYQVRIPAALQNLKQHDEAVETVNEPDISENANYVLERAQEEAAAILKEATYEAKRIMEDAYTEAKEKATAMEEEAWQKGYGEGSEAAKSQYESILTEINEIKESAMTEHDDILAGLEAEIIELVIDIAKKVIGNDIKLNKENMISLVSQAISNCSNKNKITVKVAPEDYEYLTANKDKLMEIIGNIDELELKQDMSMKPGACVLDTPFGSMDAGVQTKLVKIEEAFRELLEGK